MDIIRRGAKLVDRLVIGVTTNASKSPMFSLEERLAMVTRECAGNRYGNLGCRVRFAADGLCREGRGTGHHQGAARRCRLEYEYQMAGMNQQINDRVETVFLMADVSLQPIASRLVKEIAMFGGPIHRFVSPAVQADVEARVAEWGKKGRLTLICYSSVGC